MKEITTRTFFYNMITGAFLLMSSINLSAQNNQNYLNFMNSEALHKFFCYEKGKEIIVSGHRGAIEKGFSENSIEIFDHVLKQMPAIFEIDPRLTKDSVIVLMHDATLDRTTNSTGRLADFNWEELKEVRLKDEESNVTPHHIPTLEEVIKWSRGKTVINLDKKDVPMPMIADLIKKHKAENHVMLTVHTGVQARYYYNRFPGIMLSVFSRNDKEYEDMAISGVPWKNMIAYVGATIDSGNIEIVKKLRANGVKCMVSYAPTLDKLKTAEDRKRAYREALRMNPDIIESDMPKEVWSVIHSH